MGSKYDCAEKFGLSGYHAWICFLARKKFLQIKKQVTTLLEEDRVAITGPLFLELIQGTRNQKECEETQSWLKALHWLQIKDDHWRQAADLGLDYVAKA